MKNLRAVFVLLVILTFGCQQVSIAPITDDSGIEAKLGSPQPFRGTLIFAPDPNVSISCGCTNSVSYYSSAGSVKRLGNVTSESEICFVLTDYGADMTSMCVSMTTEDGDILYFENEPFSLYVELNCFCTMSGSTKGHVRVAQVSS